MKAFTLVLKIIMLLAVGVCGGFFNVLVTTVMLTMGLAEEKEIIPYVVYWLCFTVVFYIAPAFIAMLKKYIIAAAMTCAGAVCVIILYQMLGGYGSFFYMQLMIITVIMIVLAIVGSWDRIHGAIDEKEKQKTAPAPSILGGTTKADTADKKRESKAPVRKNVNMKMNTKPDGSGYTLKTNSAKNGKKHR